MMQMQVDLDHLVQIVVSDGNITETSGSGIVSGSQEDLIVNVGDRVFFGYDSSDFRFRCT